MAEWRWGRTWSDVELQARLERAHALPPNLDDPDEWLTPERGWNQVHSTAVVAHERPGPPVDDGPYPRARALVEALEHSDPRIVIGHFRADTPLRGRVLLLELHAMGFHFLSPVRIRQVRDERQATASVFGFQLETLAGHIESGREWFLLEKDHATGEVRFQIRAAWREGSFPGGWARLGFYLLGRRYQRAWHRLAHLRLRRLLAAHAAPAHPANLVHEGPALATEPVVFFSQRGWGRRVDVEQEHEQMRNDRLLVAAGMGALCGVRSLTQPALLAYALGRKKMPLLSRGRVAPRALGRVLGALALAEIAADKTAWLPARTQPISLLARAASGAVAGHAAGRNRRAPWVAALVGAGSAIAASFAIYRLRMLAVARSRTAGIAAGFAEDALALGGGSALARSVARASQ